MQVLYQDNHIIAINKMPSEIVQGDKTGDEPLVERVKAYLKEEYNKPGEVFLGVIHRLDRPVSGLVLYARTSKGLTRFNELFRTKNITKSYIAIVEGNPPKTTDRLIHYLVKNPNTNVTKAHIKPVEESKEAILSYTLLHRLENYCVLEIALETGRSHQIRSQLAAIGCPIKGDVKYGSKRANKDRSIHLHAHKLTFIHPIKNEPISIVADFPDEPLWQVVAQRLTTQ